MRRIDRHTLLALLSAFSIALPVWAHGGEDHDTPAAAAPATLGTTLTVTKESQFLLGIRTLVATERSLPRQVRLNGRIIARPQGQAAVMSPVTGTLLQRPMPVFGDRVRQGQTLAVVAQTLGAPERLQVKTEHLRVAAERRKAEAELQVAIGDAAVAKATWSRLQRLSQVVAKKDIPLAEQSYRAAEARVQALRAQVAQLSQQDRTLAAMGTASGGGPNRFELKAPISGTISARDAVPGAQVSPDKRLFEIVDTSEVWVEGQVFESDLALVESSQKARVQTDAYPNRRFTGFLVSLGQVVDDATRTVRAVFAIDNPGGNLRIGQFAAVSMATGQTVPQVVVPQDAIYTQNGRQWLVVHTAPETFERREVTAGETIAGQTIVTQGVKVGERIVTTGAYHLLVAIPETGKRP
jgi:cobalt-zinc-cadmium efflux system membrane fusion protein